MQDIRRAMVNGHAGPTGEGKYCLIGEPSETNARQPKLQMISHRFCTCLAIAVAFLMANVVCRAQTQGGSVVAWGDDSYGQTNVPITLTNVMAIAAGGNQCLALKTDGTILGWGSTTLPPVLSNVLAIAQGGGHTLALLSNGTVVAWGDDVSGQTDVPPGLNNVVAVAAGNVHSLALKRDGTVVAWGWNGFGESSVPAGLNNVKAIAGGGLFSLALKSDGTVVGWGYNGDGETSIPSNATNVIAIASGDDFSIALKADGTVVAWGYYGSGQINVPLGLSNVVAIAAGDYYGLALKANGTVVAWGSAPTVPGWLTNVVGIAGGSSHSLALVEGAPVIIHQPTNLSVFSGDKVSYNVSVVGTLPISYQWQYNGTNLDTATGASLTISNVQPANTGYYNAILTNPYGANTSSIAVLTVVTSAPVIISQPTNQMVVFGSNAVFNVSAIGSLPLFYQWKFNGTNIDGATSASLNLENVQATNGGNYQVTVSNSFGLVTSSGVTLIPVPPRIIIGWGGIYYDNGQHIGEIYPPLGLTNVVGIAAGGFHSMALNFDGSVACWGDNDYGQSQVPTDLTNAVGIAAGFYHSLAVKSDGTVRAWGSNASGETNIPAGLSNVVAVTAGGHNCGGGPCADYSLALKSDGTVIGWGATSVPVGVSDIVTIAGGEQHALALRRDGTIIGWGFNYNGQATPPTGLSNIVAIAAGGYHSLALRMDGTVIAWGNNYNGQTNVPFGLTNVVAISAGEISSFALRNDGTEIAWGSNTGGETGVPSGLSNVVAMAAGAFHALALQNGGTPAIVRQPLSWTVYSGSTVALSAGAVAPSPMNLQWQLNGTNLIGVTNSYVILANVQPDVAGNYALVASNPNTGIAISSNAVLTVLTSPPIIQNQPSNSIVLSGGSVSFSVSATGSLPISYQWQFNGTNIAGATNATLTMTNLTWPNNGVYAVTASNAYGAVISSNAVLTLPRNLVVAWGNNPYGQTNVPATLTNAISIAAGYENSMAVRGDGTVAGWGYNALNETIPPAGLGNVIGVATSRSPSGAFSLALKSDGTVVGWGNNASKQTNVPTGLSNAVAIAAGQSHGLALRNDGRVFVWGNNSNGQTNVPVTLTNAVAIAAGYNCCLALKSNGSLAAWGDNSYGQTNIPSGLTNVIAIASGWYHCLAINGDGSVVAWGNNSFQQTNIPEGLSNVVAISTGQYHSLAVKNDGTVVAWGQNTYKQTNVPAGLNHIVAVAGGFDHSLALIEDGPPMIFSQPLSQTNFAGFAVSLTGIASGLQPLNYQWMLNGTNINGATNPVLTLNLQAGVAGTYSFNCSNALGSVTSSNALIGVITNPPVLTLQPASQTVIAGSNVTFSVAVGAGPIPNTFQWQFNGTDISGATNLSLALTNVQTTNQGNYSAVVNNGFGTTTSSNAYLSVIVLDLPTALNTPGWTWTSSGNAVWFPQTNTTHDGVEAAQSGAVGFSQSSSLQTTVTGPGTLTFLWMFWPQSTPLSLPSTFSFSSSQANVSASFSPTNNWQQQTVYLGTGQQTLTWKYSRSGLSSQSTAWLDQVSFAFGSTAPAITFMSPDTYVRASSVASLAVGAYGTPPLAYQWQQNGTNLPGKTNASILFTVAQVTNTGLYTVTITNSFGSISTNANFWVGRFGFNGSSTNAVVTTNGFKLQLDGILTTNPVVIFGSSNLIDWLPLFTNPPTTGSVQYLDVTVTNIPARFYRARE